MDTQTAERIVARFRELLLQEAASGRPPSTINDIEAVSLSLRQKVGELVADELSAEATKEQEQAAGTLEAGKSEAGKSEAGKSEAEIITVGKVECRCGGTARFKGVRPHDLVLMSGTVRLFRRYYYCRRCDTGFCPADQKLGLTGSAYTGLVQRQLAQLCALAPYSLATETFATLCGVTVSASHSQEIVDQVDRVARAFLAEQKAQIFEAPPVFEAPVTCVASGIPSPDVLYLEADGVHTPIRGGWREMKIGLCFEKDARGRRVNKRYVSHLGDAETFGEEWYTMAAHQGAEQARHLVVLGDGAHWLWNQAQWHFPRAVQVLDLWHALERLWGVAHAAFGTEQTEQKCGWVASQKRRLEESQTEAFLSALASLSESHPTCEVITEALTYYRNNRERMDYQRYRKLGLDVGSGAVESGCKQVVSQRLKGAGMRWCEAGASAIARLRCLLLSGQWQEIGRRWEVCSGTLATS